MKTIRRVSLAIAVCLLLGPALVQAKEALFVFGAAQPTANVYDARDFQLLARPVVGPDSFHAVAAASPTNALRAGKYYVAGRASVVVLDSDFANAGIIHLAEELPRERQAFNGMCL